MAELRNGTASGGRSTTPPPKDQAKTKEGAAAKTDDPTVAPSGVKEPLLAADHNYSTASCVVSSQLNMRFGRLLLECAIFGSCVLIGLVNSWQSTWTEAICSVILVVAFIIMNGGSPLGWLVVVAAQLVTDKHWASFHTGIVDTFGDVYDGYGGWAIGFIGYLIFATCYLVHGLFLLPFDFSAFGKEVAKPYKIQPNARTGMRLDKLLPTLTVNFVVILVYLAIMTAQPVWTRGRQGYRFGGDAIDGLSLPSKQEQLTCFVVGLLWNEVWFYYSHRALHSKKLYGKVHKKHHEYTAPFALAAIYCTPLEMVLSNLWPFLGVASVFRFHVFFTYCWVANAVMGTQTHHSGHKWPWMTILDHQPHVHDLHHEKFNVNFGNVGLLDALHGTAATSEKSKEH